MANAPKKKDETKITRIKASDTSKPSVKKTVVKNAPAKVEPKAEAKGAPTTERKNPLKAMGAYFKGSWYELRQVRWPDRRATWGMTGALIAFTVFFVVLVVLIDYGFAQLFELITGK